MHTHQPMCVCIYLCMYMYTHTRVCVCASDADIIAIFCLSDLRKGGEKQTGSSIVMEALTCARNADVFLKHFSFSLSMCMGVLSA